MHIIVCIKQIPDPEAPVTKFSVDEAALKMVPAPGVTYVISPFDENAIEAALQLREIHGGKVTVLSLGPDETQEGLKRALRMEADDAVLVNNQGLPETAPLLTGYVLGKAIEKIGQFDLIICGRQAGDWDQGQVGPAIAEFLDIPCVTIVRNIEVKEGGNVRVQRLAEEGYEVMEMPMPALVTVSNEINLPRLTTVPGVMKAAKYKVPIWSVQDIDADSKMVEILSEVSDLESLSIPEIKVECQIMPGEPEEAALALMTELKKRKLI